MPTENLIGGYRRPYDPRPALERMISGDEEALEELWSELHHQGDVDTASYFAVPALVAAGKLSLVACIEIARQNPRNPGIPEKLKDRYESALREAMKTSPKTAEDCLGYYIIHATISGQPELAKALDLFEPSATLSYYGEVT